MFVMTLRSGDDVMRRGMVRIQAARKGRPSRLRVTAIAAALCTIAAAAALAVTLATGDGQPVQRRDPADRVR
jgi:hypothetical protein